MKSSRFWFAGVIFLGIVFLSSSVFSQVDTTIFQCLTADSGLPASSVVRDTISPMAIYACGTYASTDLLPSWAHRV